MVTGATGFLGRHVLGHLHACGHELMIASRSVVTGLPGTVFTIDELGPATDWGTHLAGVDAIVHLAGRAHVMRDHAGGAEEFRRTNTLGTLRLAECAAAAGVRRFVFISTIKVNGEATTDRPFTADDPPAGVDSYARSKLDAEIGLRTIRNMESVVIRPPLIHGPGAKGNLERLCRLAAAGLPVPFGGIHNSRDVLGVDNLANLIERCLWHPAAPCQVFLASDGQPLSTSQLYRLVAEGLGRRARVFVVPAGWMRALAKPIGMAAAIDRLTQSLEVDITKTRDLLGWTPPVSVAEGIGKMAKAFALGTA